MDNFFSVRRERLAQLKIRREGALQTERPPMIDNLPAVFEKCPTCNAVTPKGEIQAALWVCPACGYHWAIGADQRLDIVLDANTFIELDPALTGSNPLEFPGYSEKLRAQARKTGLREAVVTARGMIGAMPVVAVAMDSRFLMGSMGAAVGEKITRAAEAAQKSGHPLIIFCASGGARMQEGILSLMQMAKTSAAIQRFSDSGGLYISCLTHPTTGGVTASFASLGDITLAEPGALIGFAGPRVIEQTIGQKLPDGFQSAEFQNEHGYVDKIVPRGELKSTLEQILRLHGKRRKA